MKLRKTLSTLLAAALMVGLLCVPSMAASPAKVTGGSFYNTIELSSALNEGTAMLGIYASTEVARPVRIYTVQAGTTLTVTGNYYIMAHPVTLLPDGTYELKSLYGTSNDPQYLASSEKWQSWTWYTPQYAHNIPDPDHLYPSHVTQTLTSSVVLNNSHVGTWVLLGGEVILKVLPMDPPIDTRVAIYEVTSSAVNVRYGPGTYYGISRTMPRGTRFEISTLSSDGCWGRLTNGVEWVHLDNAKFIAYKQSCGVVGRQQAIWTAANTYRIMANTLPIHDGPAEGHEIVGTLSKEQLIDVAEFYGEDWGYLANGKGWVRLGYAGNYANVQYAATKNVYYNQYTGAAINVVAPDQTQVRARLAVNCADGLLEIRTGVNAGSNVPNDGAGTVTGWVLNSPVVGYLSNGMTVDLVTVQNDWGQLPSHDGITPGGWVYLPGAGNLYAVNPIA